MKATVKLVGDTDNKRAQLFSALLKDTEKFTQLGRISYTVNREANYNIIFNFKDMETLRKLKVPIPHADKFVIYDVSEDLYDNKKWCQLVTLLTVCSSYVTCANELLQEKIYEVTGRLATIVRTPIDIEKIKKPVISNTKGFLWYGSISDVFSIYKNKSNKDLTIALLNGRIEGDNVVAINSTKKKSKVLDKFDIVYLPETSTIEGEIRRLDKIKECTLLGKAVVQDIAKGLPTKKKLLEGLFTAQQILIEEEGYEAAVGQLEWALEQTPVDDYLDYVTSIA